MDTYGDMVTLLLCFFVLLYSMSTINEEKWLIVMQSFNRNALTSDNTPPGPANENNGNTGGDNLPIIDDKNEVDEALDELYDFLVEYAAQQNAASGTDGQVLVSNGDGYVFISFADAVFFDGDSVVLRKDGEKLLDGIIPALEQCGPSIDELRVLGHTAQVKKDDPNPAPGDRRIAAGRAAAVAAYIQDGIPMDRLHPSRIVDEGHGQWLNVADHDGTEANRVKNRRVELVVTGKNLDDELSDSVTQYQTMYEATQELKSTG